MTQNPLFAMVLVLLVAMFVEAAIYNSTVLPTLATLPIWLRWVITAALVAVAVYGAVKTRWLAPRERINLLEFGGVALLLLLSMSLIRTRLGELLPPYGTVGAGVLALVVAYAIYQAPGLRAGRAIWAGLAAVLLFLSFNPRAGF